MSTLTSSLMEDGTLTSVENDTYQDEMIEDLFNPANFSQTEICVEIMGSTRSGRGANRSLESRRTNRSSSVASRRPKPGDRRSSMGRKVSPPTYHSVPGTMQPIDEDIANMVREDVRKMIATVRSAKTQPKNKNEEGVGEEVDDKMLVRPGKYGECDRSAPRKQLLKKIRKEKVNRKPKSDASVDEQRDGNLTDWTEKSHRSGRSVESMKQGYYKNLRQDGPEHMSRTLATKEMELISKRQNEETPTSNASVANSIISSRSRASQGQAQGGVSVATVTSKPQPKTSVEKSWESKNETKAAVELSVVANTQHKDAESPSPSVGSKSQKRSPISSEASKRQSTNSTHSRSSVVSSCHSKNGASAAAAMTSAAAGSSALSRSNSKSSTSITSPKNTVNSGSSVVARSSSKVGSSAAMPKDSTRSGASVTSKSHTNNGTSLQSPTAGGSSVASKDNAMKGTMVSLPTKETNSMEESDFEKEVKKKKALEHMVVSEARTAMTESETRLEEDNSVLTGSVLTSSVLIGTGGGTDGGEDEIEEQNRNLEEASPSLSTVSYVMTQVEASKEEEISEEIECVLSPFDELETAPSIKPDPSAKHDMQRGRNEDAAEESAQKRGGAPPGAMSEQLDEKKSLADDLSTDSTKKSLDQKDLRGQEAPARSSQSLIASMQSEADETVEETFPAEGTPEEDSGEISAGETTAGEETAGGDSYGEDKETTVELVLVDESIRLRQLEIENAKLKDTLNFLQKTAVEKEKYFAELAWFGKRSEEEVQKWRPNFWQERLKDFGPELFEEFRADAMRIADPDVGDWEHGFSSGSLAMARLLLGLSHAVDDEKICAFHDNGQPCTKHCVTCTVAEQRNRELADFPVLDP